MIINRIYIGVIGILILALGSSGFFIRMQQSNIEKKVTEIAELKISNASLASAANVLEELRAAGDDIAKQAALTCQKTIEFKVKHVVEAKEIQNAPDADSAIAAYDSLLCRRPEAAGHPKCTGAPTAP